MCATIAAKSASSLANIFLVQINIKELADLAAIVAHMARQLGKARGQLRKSFRNCAGTTVHIRRAVSKAAKRRRDFNGHWHVAHLLCSLSSLSAIRALLGVRRSCLS